jgi:hypothetical protein
MLVQIVSVSLARPIRFLVFLLRRIGPQKSFIELFSRFNSHLSQSTQAMVQHCVFKKGNTASYGALVNEDSKQSYQLSDIICAN